jgi:hypothetical protein
VVSNLIVNDHILTVQETIIFKCELRRIMQHMMMKVIDELWYRTSIYYYHTFVHRPKPAAINYIKMHVALANLLYLQQLEQPKHYKNISYIRRQNRRLWN